MVYNGRIQHEALLVVEEKQNEARNKCSQNTKAETIDLFAKFAYLPQSFKLLARIKKKQDSMDLTLAVAGSLAVGGSMMVWAIYTEQCLTVIAYHCLVNYHSHPHMITHMV